MVMGFRTVGSRFSDFRVWEVLPKKGLTWKPNGNRDMKTGDLRGVSRYLEVEGRGDLEKRLRLGIHGVMMCFFGFLYMYLPSSPEPKPYTLNHVVLVLSH